MDICWQKQVQKSTKYLYTLSKKHHLCRHPVAYELAVCFCFKKFFKKAKKGQNNFFKYFKTFLLDFYVY